MHYDHGHKLVQQVERCIPPPVMEMLRAHSAATLSGGFVRDAIVGHPYNDIDIYFELPQTAATIAEWFRNKMGVEIEEHADKFQFWIDVAGPNTDDTLIMFEPRLVQLIHGHRIMNFDLACCMSTYSPRQALMVNPYVLDHNIGLREPTPGTLPRIAKLIARGWHYSIDELVAAAKVYEPDHKSRQS